MSATFPADVFETDTPVWISEPLVISERPGCYIGIHESTHLCGKSDLDCPIGLAMLLAYGEYEMFADPEPEDDDTTCSDPDCLCD